MAPRSRGRMPIGTLRVLRHRDYAVVAIGNFVSQLGTWSQYIGIGWAARGLTHRPFLVTFAFGAQFLPNLVLSPFGGLVADRFNRRITTILGNLGMALPAAAIGLMIQRHALTITWLIVLAFLGGTMQTLTQPASTALIPALVPLDEVQPAVAVNSVLQNLSRFVGAALAGVIIRVFGTAASFHFNAASFFAVVAAWLIVRPVLPKIVVMAEPFLQRLGGGLRFARGSPTVRNLLVINATSTIFILQQPLLPLITDRVLHSGSGTYGLLTSATGLGAIGGALVAGQLNTDPRRRLLMAVGLTCTTASVFGVALSHWVPLSVFLQILFGFGFFMTVTISMTVLMVVTPDDYRGRVIALQQLSSAGMIPVMSFLAGGLADLLGIAPALIAAGCAQVATVLWFMLGGGLASVGVDGVAGREVDIEPAALPDDLAPSPAV